MNFNRILSTFLTLAIILSAFAFVVPMSIAAENEFGDGTVYYVDAENGNDSNSGTSQSSAWKSLDKVNSTTFKAGETVLLNMGSIWHDTYLSPKGSGVKDNPITVSSYGEGEEKPTIISKFNVGDPGKPNVDASVLLSNQDYVVIENLNIINNNISQTDQFGVRVLTRNGHRTYGVVIRNCTISGSETDWTSKNQQKLIGIGAISENYNGFIGSLTIADNEIYNVKDAGIVIDGARGGSSSTGNPKNDSALNVLIRNNYLSNIGKDGIKTINVNSPLVEYNVVNKSHSYAKTSWHVALWTYASYNAIFQFNEAYDTKTVYDAQGYDCDYQSYYSTFQYNYSHNNEGGFMLICTEPKNWDGGVAFNYGSIVRYNISQNDKYRTFTLTGHITDTKIYNNTIYNDVGDANHFLFTYSRDSKTWPINTQFRNNIFYINSGEFSWNGSTGTVWENNIVYGNAKANAPENDNNGGASDAITASANIYEDPKFANAGGATIGIDSCDAYVLNEGSPAFNAGQIIIDDNDRDFFGNPVLKDKAPNIGAYNGDGSTPQQTTTDPTQPSTPGDFIYGDVNGDSNVNLKDSLELRKYIANLDVEIDLEASDVNLDGDVNSADSLLLRKFLANWDVQLGV